MTARNVTPRSCYLIIPSTGETFPTVGITAKITYLPGDFSCDAWRGECLTGRGDKPSVVLRNLSCNILLKICQKYFCTIEKL
jgi:hypothetical protein